MYVRGLRVGRNGRPCADSPLSSPSLSGSSLQPNCALLMLSCVVTMTIPVWVLLGFAVTNFVAAMRFAFFFVQLICMLWMAVLVVQHAA